MGKLIFPVGIFTRKDYLRTDLRLRPIISLPAKDNINKISMNQANKIDKIQLELF